MKYNVTYQQFAHYLSQAIELGYTSIEEISCKFNATEADIVGWIAQDRKPHPTIMKLVMIHIDSKSRIDYTK